jgi:hypothetical protein
MSIENRIDRRVEAIIFHDGGEVTDRVKQRAQEEVIYEQIHEFKTMDEMREILHYLALKAGLCGY